MFSVGEVVDSKYQVDGVCSDTGGMGEILFITPIDGPSENKLVLKYCKETEAENIARFRREVRLMSEFSGNSKIVQLIDYNVKHDPPYYVMKYYEKGDLSNLEIGMEEYEKQELIFLKMVDCIAELHSNNRFHRDIKPQNFLVEGDDIVVSDFGLSMEVGSSTALTRSSAYWGTPGYLPPEFKIGGFKHADATGDIFMLGKTFYAILTKRDPMYLVDDGLPSPLVHLINRCCNLDKKRRYQSLAELKQSITAAYDVLLGRTGGVGQARQMLQSINELLETENQYNSTQVKQFIEKLSLLDDGDKESICSEITVSLFHVIKQQPLEDVLYSFLNCYELHVRANNYPWPHAETIALGMKAIFDAPNVPDAIKARALDLAIHAAVAMNRFAAMDTCAAMIKTVTNEELGIQISDIVKMHPGTFLSNIEQSECKSDVVRQAIGFIKAKESG